MARGGLPPVLGAVLSQPVSAALAMQPRLGKGVPEGRQFPGLHTGQKHHDARSRSFPRGKGMPMAGAFHPGRGAAYHA